MTIKQATNSTCAYVALIGRSNVGKSTLLNTLLGEKLCITSRRLQTTRHKILGIKTKDNYQIIYVDTPGWQRQTKHQLNQMMNKTAESVWHDVDILLWVIDISYWHEEDEKILAKLKQIKKPVFLLINKIDLLADKNVLLPRLQELGNKMAFADMLPISAKTGANVDALEQQLIKLLPDSPHFFPEDQITDRRESFIIAEIIREKILRLLSQEVPHHCAVMVERVEDKTKCLYIDAVIWVERRGQKAIIIGKGGEKLKEIGRRARLSLQARYDKPVMLKLWVQIKNRWTDELTALRQLDMDE
ncbi:MAG: GTPase Era [Pseudomonadota bacterium]